MAGLFIKRIEIMRINISKLSEKKVNELINSSPLLSFLHENNMTKIKTKRVTYLCLG